MRRAERLEDRRPNQALGLAGYPLAFACNTRGTAVSEPRSANHEFIVTNYQAARSPF